MAVTHLAVLGGGGTGLSLALNAARAGIIAHVIEPDPHALERVQHFAHTFDRALAADVHFTAESGALADAGLIFDTGDPDPVTDWPAMDGTTILATPQASPRASPIPKARCLRMVFFQPMQFRALTELSGFPETTDAVLETAAEFVRQIGRIPVRVPEGARSPGLRLLDRLQATADQSLLEGAVLWELDEAMTGFGFDLGLYEAQDLTGLDVAYARRKSLGQRSLIADRAVEEGRLGKKIGWGWYRYPGGGGAVIDPLIEDLIREEAHFAGITQRDIGASEMIERLIDALRSEVTQIINDSQVCHPDDLSLILTAGLGYPKDKLAMLTYPRGSSGG